MISNFAVSVSRLIGFSLETEIVKYITCLKRFYSPVFQVPTDSQVGHPQRERVPAAEFGQGLHSRHWPAHPPHGSGRNPLLLQSTRLSDHLRVTRSVHSIPTMQERPLKFHQGQEGADWLPGVGLATGSVGERQSGIGGETSGDGVQVVPICVFRDF